MCHLSVFAFRGGAALECAACGAGGTLRTEDGAFRVDFTAEGLAQSVIALAEKRAHFQEVQETAAGTRRTAPRSSGARPSTSPGTRA